MALSLKGKNAQKKNMKRAVSEDRTLQTGISTLKELLAPDGVIFRSEHIELSGERFARLYGVKDYPRQVWVGFLDEIYEYDVKVAIFLEPLPSEKAQTELTKLYVREQAQLLAEERRGDVRNLRELQRHADDLDELRDAVAMNNDHMLYVTIILMVEADSLEELDRQCKTLEERMAARGLLLRRLFLRQKEAFKSLMPIHKLFVKGEHRNMDRYAATALFPFSQAELSQENGIFLGQNIITGSPVFWDGFNPALPNYNLNVFAPSGYGKSFFMKLIAMRSALQGVRTVFIDQDGEYSRLTRLLEGAAIDFHPGGETPINPFDLEEEEDVETKIPTVDIAAKIQEMVSLIETMFGYREKRPLLAEEIGVLEHAITALYAKRGITTHPNSLYMPDPRPGYQGYVKKPMPTISELYEELEQNGGRIGRKMLPMLEPYRHGEPMGIFDGQSKFQLRNQPLVNFNLKDLEESTQKPVAMHVILTWIWEHFVKRNPKVRKRVIADEAWIMLRSEQSAQFLDTMARRARKRNTSLTVASQQFSDFATHETGRAVLTQAATTMLMRQSDFDLQNAAEVYRLPQGQQKFIETSGVGAGLLRIGHNTIALQVRAIDFEQSYVETNPQLADD